MKATKLYIQKNLGLLNVKELILEWFRRLNAAPLGCLVTSEECEKIIDKNYLQKWLECCGRTGAATCEIDGETEEYEV